MFHFQCYEWVLRKAQGLDWSEDSAKALVVIGDAPPHPPGYTDAQVFWKDELSLLTGMGIKVKLHLVFVCEVCLHVPQLVVLRVVFGCIILNPQTE